MERREDYPRIIEHLGSQAVILARIDERQQTACKELEGINLHLKQLNGRTSKLEKWQSYIKGGVAVIGSLGIGGLLLWLIQIWRGGLP